MERDQMEDLEEKCDRLRSVMEQENADGCLIGTDINLYYMTGRVFDGYYYLPVDGDPFFFIRRPNNFEGKNVVFFRKVELLQKAFENQYLKMPRRLMLEGDELDYNHYSRILKALHPDLTLNATTALRNLRRIKTPWEIQQIRQCAALHNKVYNEIPHCYRPGMTDLAFQTEIEYLMRRNGSIGLMKTFGSNMSIFMGSVLAGENAENPSPFDFALGGSGQTAICPIGANGTMLKEGMSVMVDMAGNFSPYMTDMSRVFSIGKLDDVALHAHQVSIQIHREVMTHARPGIACADLYNRANEIADKEDLSDYFMGWSQHAKFVGHGIGLQVNEPPVLTPRSKEELQAGMTIAFEPKFVIPEVGAVGIENTYLITDDGAEKLTLSEEEIIDLNKTAL